MSNDAITIQSLRKWGNSAGVIIPKKVISKAHLKLNEDLSVSVKGRSVILTPVKKEKRFTLQDMLKGVTPKDVAGEYDWGSSVGKEIW